MAPIYPHDPDGVQTLLQAALSGRYFARLLNAHLKVVMFALHRTLRVTQGCDAALDVTRDELRRIGERLEQVQNRLTAQIEMRDEAAVFYERAAVRIADANLLDDKEAA